MVPSEGADKIIDQIDCVRFGGSDSGCRGRSGYNHPFPAIVIPLAKNAVPVLSSCFHRFVG
jgi:hypothetical protein